MPTDAKIRRVFAQRAQVIVGRRSTEQARREAETLITLAKRIAPAFAAETLACGATNRCPANDQAGRQRAWINIFTALAIQTITTAEEAA